MTDLIERVKVGVVLPRPQADPGEWLSDAVAFEAAGADALWVEHGAAPSLDPLTLAAALAAMTYRSLLAVAVPQTPAPQALATVEQLSRGRLVLIEDGPRPGGVRTVVRLAGGGTYEEAGAGRWTPVAVPLGRPAWREALRLAAEHGDHGVLVPADPRLLDLLRNPDDPGGRHDLQLAQG
ncbi:LLM class flavin-dependent oxidoreductase [Nonomuraea basaltis]|uniref:LLM class flavin-dependent oxidoreductase n=1 Tax=Nonomuraea basaltis TaxID=2495887 RepID=UPI0014873613|nr:LLM class flavin-dependent oxidoreductase [Nonomuraea basaltis]